ncbi:hypothetical protein COB64_03950 [Candidatus Wolfebacteria bacterium]|nr:MAG: hypothetical protein COB64_03950 [Candidatus Wolfebacteria bacterium]
MDLEEAKNEVLEALFEKYKENPNLDYNIAEDIKECDHEPHKLGKHLVSNRWVKNHQYQPLDGFVCQISIRGINEVAPEYFESNVSVIVSVLKTTGVKQNATALLGLEEADFTKVRDIVEYMERKGLIEKPTYFALDAQIELSLEGQDYYEKNKGGWLF